MHRQKDRKGKDLRSTTATVSDVIHAHYDALTR
ncbi:MAG TPA: RpiR family transcriptional regulator, partial [Agrobacterium sp.]|nr:RpiR family transcriptional regulator [Agrobacterium sp.]